jgi:hypothetical protein
VCYDETYIYFIGKTETYRLLCHSNIIDSGYGSSGSAYDTDFDFNPFAGWIDEVYVWGRSLNQYDMTLIFTTVLNSNLSLRRAKGYDQVSQDIHLTVFILLVGSLSFAACIWYQRARYFRNDGELHNN